MSDKADSTVRRRSVIAIAQADSKLKAVELRKEAGTIEVLWAKSSKGNETQWRQFAAECRLPVDVTEEAQADGDRTIVAGFNSAGVAFYRLNMPAVGEAEAASIVKLQAESRLPLPAEQMKLTWRAGQTENGQMAVTMAAARTEHLQEFVENVRCISPKQIMLDCEAVVSAWKMLFSGDARAAVIVNTSAQDSQICLAEEGRLSNAVVLDIGTEDFSTAGRQTETTERFVQDMRSVLDLFGYGGREELPIVVLSDGGKAIKRMASALKSAGLNARAVMPDVEEISGASELGVEGIYEYRVPIGLGLAALEEQADELNIFEDLYSPVEKKEKKQWFYSLKVTCAIAAVMLVALVIIYYAIDVASPGAIGKSLEAALSGTQMNELMARQELRKAIARERPDVLELINIVNKSGEGGIKLNGLHFKMGQPVSITGEAPGTDQLYKFEETLNNNKDIKEAKIQNFSKDTKGNKWKFTITFKYKKLSEKRTRR